MNEINVRAPLFGLLCFLAAYGPSAKGQDVSQLVTQLCSQRHQRRLDTVTCIGSQTKSGIFADLGRARRNLSPPALKAMACALSYSGVKLSQIKNLIEVHGSEPTSDGLRTTRGLGQGRRFLFPELTPAARPGAHRLASWTARGKDPRTTFPRAIPRSRQTRAAVAAQ
ncbi:uncharacterized protein [Dermacentor albipictus]|uniref:uncharacterized protein isoform X2 n=1 Tax=Dermacentor albipictus TaxID=60249 RepID=UPI0038FCC267